MDATTGRKVNQAVARLTRSQTAIVFLLITSFLVFMSVRLAYKKVVLTVDGEPYFVHTFAHSVAEVLNESGFVAGNADLLSHALTEPVKSGMVIELKKAFPVTVQADGRQIVCWVAEATVEEVLQRQGIELGGLDRVDPEPGHLLKVGDMIHITRIYRNLVTERTEIPFRQISRGNDTLDRGESRVLQRGISGLREDTVEVIYENGEEVSVRVLQSEILRLKQDRIVEYGENTQLSRGGRTINFNTVFQASVTAYCPGTAESGCPIDSNGKSKCTGRYNDGITASGLPARAGSGQEDDPHLVAVDRRLIPLGSRLYIDGYGFAIAADVGGAIVGNRLDLLFSNHEAAWKFGRKNLRVYLLP
jgi:uncharacterized protein YabE (DUF348 family)/3D (Asp-Asp-Asp) domain-containing protein